MKLIKNSKSEYQPRGVTSPTTKLCKQDSGKVEKERDKYLIDENWYFDWTKSPTSKNYKG